MTKQELAYAQFANLYDFSYYAQPDGSDKSVIFIYSPKRMYEQDKSKWIEPIRFEAESLEKAFNYAFTMEGLIKVAYYEFRKMIGDIKQFQIDSWSKVKPPTHFWSIGEERWKCLEEVIEQEKQAKYATV